VKVGIVGGTGDVEDVPVGDWEDRIIDAQLAARTRVLVG
jgi:hypothetical protein